MYGIIGDILFPIWLEDGSYRNDAQLWNVYFLGSSKNVYQEAEIKITRSYPNKNMLPYSQYCPPNFN